MLRLIKLFIWISIISIWVLYYWYSSYISGPDCSSVQVIPKKIVVEKWETFSSVLEKETWSTFYSKAYLKLNPPNFWLQAWSYEIISACGIDALIESLKTPINEEDISLTFLEGWNIFDIDQFLTNKSLIQAWEFISFAENHSLASDYVFLQWITSLEGYLYPDTYAINPNNFSIEILARKMLNNFNKKIFQGYLVDADNETIFEIITLASIVEKEERNDNEKATVAGILKKRLDEWWMIGADITVCYPFRLTAEQCKLSVTKYLYEKNDYNTRQKVGLPAGPIWNPSEVTIKATLFPKNTDYYYYLHDTQTGQIYYWVTNADHERNKSLYLR